MAYAYQIPFSEALRVLHMQTSSPKRTALGHFQGFLEGNARIFIFRQPLDHGFRWVARDFWGFEPPAEGKWGCPTCPNRSFASPFGFPSLVFESWP